MSDRPNLPNRVNSVLVRMLRYQEGSAIDYGRDVISHGSGGHGKHGTTTQAPTLRDSLFVEWGDRFHRMCAAAEKACETYEKGPVRRGDTSRLRRRRIIEAYVGLPLAEAAFIEGCSTDLIRKTRAAQNRNVEDGTRLPRIKGPDHYESDDKESR